jgi:hypothetical protein
MCLSHVRSSSPRCDWSSSASPFSAPHLVIQRGHSSLSSVCQTHLSGGFGSLAGGYSYPACFCCPNNNTAVSSASRTFSLERLSSTASLWRSSGLFMHWSRLSGSFGSLAGGYSYPACPTDNTAASTQLRTFGFERNLFTVLPQRSSGLSMHLECISLLGWSPCDVCASLPFSNARCDRVPEHCCSDLLSTSLFAC